ncbi:hypothetical protein F2Q68_00039054 [Brassica cretica]|uniref:Uncharacterized protein n=1 Tax=Brassica cretica TaxID=69181 RepID=A0A8S9MEJ4_BRACR|nr:hypothetical protein F2Q68_00039054 [Brassica cretica]
MARRFTSEEKGKAITQNSTGPPRLRMRAPEFDPTDLIKENMLKLVGRLTNPKEQRMRAVLSYLARKWNLMEHASGSDLGPRNKVAPSSFQQNNPQKARTQMDHRNNEVTSPPYTRRRTTYHTDIHGEGNIAERKDNSPVLQWRAKSPVVTQEVMPPSSPFQPPRRSVGRNMESGDFPPAIELPSREEVLEELRETSLQYISCPDPMESAARKQRVLQSEMNGDVEEAATRILQASAALARTETLQVSELQIHSNQENLQAETPTVPTRKRGRPPTSKGRRTTVRDSPKTFSGMGSKKRNIARLHASPGTSSRAGTRQTTQQAASSAMRAPEFDPTDLIKENMLKLVGPRNKVAPSSFQQNNPQKARTQMDHRNNEVTSPPYTRRRTTYHTDRHGEGNIAERKDNSPVLQWRAKSPVVAQEVTPPSSPFQPPRRSVGRNLESGDFPPAIELPSREEVLEELRETTLQYISCPDPMESAARKQRVLQSEMNRGVEEAATRILQASAALARTEALQVSELL